jgi:hypothetical protein
MQTKIGTLTGTGAALNLELGFIPEFFEIFNITDGDIKHSWFDGMTAANAFQNVSHADTQNSVITSNGITRFAGEAPGKTLTGTFSITTGLKALTGSSTLMLTELKAGDVVQIGDQDLTIESITSATAATTVEAANGTETSAAFCVRKTGRSEGVTLGTSVCEASKVLRYVALKG